MNPHSLSNVESGRETHGVLSQQLEKMSSLMKDLKTQFNSSTAVVLRPQTAGPRYKSTNFSRMSDSNAAMIENFNQIVCEIDAKQAQFDAFQWQRDEMMLFIKNILSMMTESEMDGCEWYAQTQSILSKTPNMFGKFMNRFQTQLMEQLVASKQSHNATKQRLFELERALDHKSKIVERLLLYDENEKVVNEHKRNNLQLGITPSIDHTIDTIPEEMPTIPTQYDSEKSLFVENLVYLESYINEQYSNLTQIIKHFESDQFWKLISNNSQYANTFSDIENELIHVENNWNHILTQATPQHASVISQALRKLFHLKRQQRTCLQTVFSLYSRFHHCFVCLKNAINDGANRAEIVHSQTMAPQIKYKIEVININDKKKLSIDLPCILKNLDICQDTFQNLSQNAISFHHLRYNIQIHVSQTNKVIESFPESNRMTHETEQQAQNNQPYSAKQGGSEKSSRVPSTQTNYEASEEDEESRCVDISESVSSVPDAGKREHVDDDESVESLTTENGAYDQEKTKSGSNRRRKNVQHHENKRKKTINRANRNDRNGNDSKFGQRMLDMDSRLRARSHREGKMEPMEMKQLLNVLQNQTDDMVNLVSLKSPSSKHDYIPLLSLKHDKEYFDRVLDYSQKSKHYKHNKHDKHDKHDKHMRKRKLSKSMKARKAMKSSNRMDSKIRDFDKLDDKEQKEQERAERDRIILFQNFKKKRMMERDKLKKELNEAKTGLERCKNRMLTLKKQKHTGKDKEDRLKLQCKKEIESIDRQIDALKRKPRKSLTIQDLKQLQLILNVTNNKRQNDYLNDETGTQMTQMMIEQMIQRKQRIIDTYKRQIVGIRSINWSHQSKKLQKQKSKLAKRVEAIIKEIKKFDCQTKEELIKFKKATIKLVNQSLGESRIEQAENDKNDKDEIDEKRQSFPDSMVGNKSRRPLSSLRVNDMTRNDLKKLENESGMTRDVFKVLQSQQGLKRMLAMQQYQTQPIYNKVDHFRPNTAPSADNRAPAPYCSQSHHNQRHSDERVEHVDIDPKPDTTQTNDIDNEKYKHFRRIMNMNQFNSCNMSSIDENVNIRNLSDFVI